MLRLRPRANALKAGRQHSPKPCLVAIIRHRMLDILDARIVPMTELIPPGFLFRLSLPVRKGSKLPRATGAPLQLGSEFSLPAQGELSQGKHFADLRLAWNERGLGFRVAVSGKKLGTRCDFAQPLNSDGLQVWIDTRSTQNIHRASRFCHHFCLLPAGAMRDRSLPVVKQVPIARAKEDAPQGEIKRINIHSEILDDGYILEAWFPAEVLNGYEPESNPRLGFYYLLRDHELGEQVLSVGPEFPFDHDPSLWWPLELI